MGSRFQVKKLLKSIMNIILRAKIPSKLQWRRQGLGGGGQQANSDIGASTTKGNKGRNKHKCKKFKVTFAQLLDKYQNKSEEKSAYRPTNAKASRSPLGTNPRIRIRKTRIECNIFISLFWAANANVVDASLCSCKSISIMGQV